MAPEQRVMRDHETDMGTTPHQMEPVQPLPPRYWWLKRIAAASALFLVALLTLRLWWGAVAHRRLQEAIEACQARGEPIYPEDFDTPPVPDELNAVVLLQQAETFVTQPVGVTIDASTIANYPWSVGERLEAVRALVEANRQALDLVREARGRPEIDWGIQMRSPMVNFVLPSLTGHRMFVKLLCATALYQAEVGDPAGAIDTIRDGLFVADAVRLQPTLISNIVAVAIDDLCMATIEAVAPNLLANASETVAKQRISGEGPPLSENPRSEIGALVDHLVAEDTLRRSMDLAIRSERATFLDGVILVRSGQVSLAALQMGMPARASVVRRVAVWPLNPLLETDALAMMRWAGQWRDHAREFRWRGSDTKRPPENPIRGMAALTRPMSAVLLPSLHRYYYLNLRVVTRRRMAATALAIRLYELDHGARPEALRELVPKYLPSIPVDPFEENGATITYRPMGERAILYSVGEDGVDDGGAFRLDPRRRIEREKLDMPYFLDGERPH